MLPSILLSFATRWFGWTSFFYNPLGVASNEKIQGNLLTFELRHLHAHSGSQIVFSDVGMDSQFVSEKKFNLRTRRVKVHRPRSHESFVRARWRSLLHAESTDLPWDEDEVEGPDVSDRETLLLLAKMTYDAYVEPTDKDWYDLGDKWSIHYPIGWEPDADGFRGYVFATQDNSTVVLSIKGTSAGVFGGGGPTVGKDKLNDNLLFSCCCARVDWTWTTVCDCHRGGWKCDQSCVSEALIEDSLFYPIGTNLYNNLTYLYPDANIWITGHSLGGALSSLVGVTFGAPVVTFESPGEKMASRRLHLPQPPSTQHITHVYHTADPIPMGTCTGYRSSCAIFGYAMESKCHLGNQIIYDTVSNLSWSVDIRTHTIATVIERLLAEPWPPALEDGREVPLVTVEEDCVECYSWEFTNLTNAMTVAL